MRPGLGADRARARARSAHPQRAFRLVHVAGTNGKGSTAAFLAAAAGARGLPDRPLHLAAPAAASASGSEVDGREIPRRGRRSSAALAGAAAAGARADLLRGGHRAGLPALRRRAASRWRWSRRGWAARLDATNVLRAAVSVLTRIALDHLEILGPDLRAHRRARRRASSSRACRRSRRPRLPCPRGARAARPARSAPRCSSAGRDFRWRRDSGGLTVEGRAAARRPGALLAGAHQEENAALARRRARRPGWPRACGARGGAAPRARRGALAGAPRAHRARCSSTAPTTRNGARALAAHLAPRSRAPHGGPRTARSEAAGGGDGAAPAARRPLHPYPAAQPARARPRAAPAARRRGASRICADLAAALASARPRRATRSWSPARSIWSARRGRCC